MLFKNNTNQKIIEKYNKLLKIKYIKGNFMIGHIIEFIKEINFRFTEWKYCELLKSYGIDTKK